jgi:hypothetical protein
MVQHYEPFWGPKETYFHGSSHRVPNADSPWAIRIEAHSEEVTHSYRKFMTNRIAIAMCLRSKNNLSALGPDGIGYLFLKPGWVPQIEFIRKVFKECVKAENAPDTWKHSHTVFIFKKGETNLPCN